MIGMVEDHERGLWFDLLDPIKCKPTGMRVKLAGPDSATQARARVLLVDELAEFADLDGRVSGEARETARLRNLARCVIAWDVAEGGEALPFTFANVLRLLRAGVWAQSQIDALAADRRLWAKGSAE